LEPAMNKPPESATWPVESLLRAAGINPHDDKIKAIVLVRRATPGVSLKQAKDLVEAVLPAFPSSESVKTLLYRAEARLEEVARILRVARDTYQAAHPDSTLFNDRELAKLNELADEVNDLAERAGGCAAAGVGQ
jgi:hypothetical protein